MFQYPAMVLRLPSSRLFIAGSIATADEVQDVVGTSCSVFACIGMDCLLNLLSDCLDVSRQQQIVIAMEMDPR